MDRRHVGGIACFEEPLLIELASYFQTYFSGFNTAPALCWSQTDCPVRIHFLSPAPV